MSRVRFLIDESVRLSVVAALRRIEPLIDVIRVGQSEGPSFGTSDAELLCYCEETRRLLVSSDRGTFPDHVADHLAVGRHSWGVLLIVPGCTYRELLDELLVIWSASEAEEWQDTLHYLPLS
jgi:Domain of unknown function (DUF5615)